METGAPLLLASGPSPGSNVNPESNVVLRGQHLDLTWEVLLSGEVTMLFTMLQVRRGDVLVLSSGFGGPALYPGESVNDWRGREDATPYFVMARTRLEISRVVAKTDQGSQIELLTTVDSVGHGLRFHANGLPEGHAPESLLLFSTASGWREVFTPVASDKLS